MQGRRCSYQQSRNAIIFKFWIKIKHIVGQMVMLIAVPRYWYVKRCCFQLQASAYSFCQPYKWFKTGLHISWNSTILDDCKCVDSVFPLCIYCFFLIDQLSASVWCLLGNHTIGGCSSISTIFFSQPNAYIAMLKELQALCQAWIWFNVSRIASFHSQSSESWSCRLKVLKTAAEKNPEISWMKSNKQYKCSAVLEYVSSKILFSQCTSLWQPHCQWQKPGSPLNVYSNMVKYCLCTCKNNPHMHTAVGSPLHFGEPGDVHFIQFKLDQMVTSTGTCLFTHKHTHIHAHKHMQGNLYD